MLEQDERTFQEEYYRAANFLLASALRSECVMLHNRTAKTEGDMKRLDELLNCPACQEEWFVKEYVEKQEK
jgi:hypothetical protein